jgi:hypothetical protein
MYKRVPGYWMKCPTCDAKTLHNRLDHPESWRFFTFCSKCHFVHRETGQTRQFMGDPAQHIALWYMLGD